MNIFGSTCVGTKQHGPRLCLAQHSMGTLEHSSNGIFGFGRRIAFAFESLGDEKQHTYFDSVAFCAVHCGAQRNLIIYF